MGTQPRAGGDAGNTPCASSIRLANPPAGEMLSADIVPNVEILVAENDRSANLIC